MINYKNPKVLFKAARFSLIEHDVDLGDSIFKHQLCTHPGAVVILPLIDKETLVLIKNRRYAVAEELWELAAGTLEEGEEPLNAAKRELLEETGYGAKQFQKLTSFYSTPGFCNEKLDLFLATDLKFYGQNLDQSERITAHKVSLSKALEMVNSGEICDAKTMLSLLFYKQFSLRS